MSMLFSKSPSYSSLKQLQISSRCKLAPAYSHSSNIPEVTAQSNSTFRGVCTLTSYFQRQCHNCIIFDLYNNQCCLHQKMIPVSLWNVIDPNLLMGNYQELGAHDVNPDDSFWGLSTQLGSRIWHFTQVGCSDEAGVITMITAFLEPSSTSGQWRHLAVTNSWHNRSHYLHQLQWRLSIWVTGHSCGPEWEEPSVRQDDCKTLLSSKGCIAETAEAEVNNSGMTFSSTMHGTIFIAE